MTSSFWRAYSVGNFVNNQIIAVMVSRIHRRSADQKRLGDPKPYGKNDNGDDKNEFYKIKNRIAFF